MSEAMSEEMTTLNDPAPSPNSVAVPATAPTQTAPAMDNRIKAYKNKGKDGGIEEMRQRRKEVTVEIRKKKRSEQLAKRRNMNESDEEDEEDEEPGGEDIRQKTEELRKALSGNDDDAKFKATQQCRILLSRRVNPPIAHIVSSGIIPILIDFLQLNDKPNFQYEAAWTLTNICSGDSDHTAAVVNCNGIQSLICTLASPVQNVHEQAVWALSNIAGTNAEMRNKVTDAGCVPPLLALLNDKTPLSLLRNITWTLANFCRYKDPPARPEVVQMIFPVLSQLINNQDEKTVEDAVWALSYLTDGFDDYIPVLVDSNTVIPRLGELLAFQKHPKRTDDIDLLTPALRTIGNICSGYADTHTQRVLDFKILPRFHRLLFTGTAEIKKEVTYTISNITAGTKEQIQAVIDENLMPYLFNILLLGDMKTQKEAVWAITNLTNGGTHEQIAFVVQMGMVPPLCDLLSVKDTEMVRAILIGLFNILNAADQFKSAERISLLIEECGGLDKIEELQRHENEHIYETAFNIVDKFFENMDDGEDYMEPETTEDGQQFKFDSTKIEDIEFDDATEQGGNQNQGAPTFNF